jgi:hypothetical protein
MQPTETNLADYALKLLSRGFVCVPLSREGRHLDLETMGYAPLHLRTMRKNLKELAFSSVTFQLSQHPPDSDTIANWFDGFSGNVGIVGGFANLAVLDFDREDLYGKWRRKHPDLASSTPTAKSPNGFHVYLRTETPEVSSSLHLGFRRAGYVKALGGYVLCPPSQMGDGAAYRWLPAQSPFETEIRTIESFRRFSLRPVSPFKSFYDRILDRGGFDPN